MTKDSTMIDRVAAAIQGASVNQPWSYENAARAAIAAMREPTEAMRQAAYDAVGNAAQDSGRMAWDCDSDRAWQAMIDAAIAEGHE